MDVVANSSASDVARTRRSKAARTPHGTAGRNPDADRLCDAARLVTIRSVNTRWFGRLARSSRALAAGLLIVASVDAFAHSAGIAVPYAGGAVQSAATSARSDATFLAARAAYEAGDWPTLDALATALADYPLARYVTFWQIESRIDAAAPQTVHGFLSRYPDSPLSARLEVDWLKSLGKRGEWASFAIDYPPPAGEDAELECYGIQYRWQRDGERALAAAKPLWFTGKSTPESCEPLFTALIAAGSLTLADRRERFRLATASGNLRLAHAIADVLPGNARITARQFAGVDRDPLRAVANGRISLSNPGARELALYALDRAARNDASAARKGWLRWRGRMSRADRDYGNLRVAYQAARQLDPRADAWFREVRDPGPGAGPAQSSPGAVEDWKLWRVRAALRSLAWDDAAQAIDALPADVKQQPDWRYWRARSLAARGRGDEARSIYAGLLGDLHYYGLLAAEALGLGAAEIDALKLSHTAKPDPTALDAFAARPGVQRAVKLAELDLRPESLREWAYAIRGLDDDALLVAARLRAEGRTLRPRDRHRRQGGSAVRHSPCATRRRIEASSLPLRVSRGSTLGCSTASHGRNRASSPISHPPRGQSA